jgi:hypothetical protein
MAQWYTPLLLGLMSVLFINCGVLYMMFNSSFDEMCDYTDAVNQNDWSNPGCDGFANYIEDADLDFAKEKKRREWQRQAMILRNQSEVEKCRLERELLTTTQGNEKTKAQEIVAQCMQDFRNCVSNQYTTTTTTLTVNCTACNTFCRTTDWPWTDKNYSDNMYSHSGERFTGVCGATVCPWLPECGTGGFMHAKCQALGCPCPKQKCTTTTTTTTSVTSVTTNTSTTTTVTSPTTNFSTVTTVTTTSTTNTTFSTTTSNTTATTVTTTTRNTTTTLTTTVTNTSTTTNSTTTTESTTTKTTTNTTTTTSTTTTLTTTVTNTSTSTNTSTTTTTVAECTCEAMPHVDTVIVGPPYRRFYGFDWNYVLTSGYPGTPSGYPGPMQTQSQTESIKYWQGVIIEAPQPHTVGGPNQLDPAPYSYSCYNYFSNKSTYYGPRTTHVTNRSEAEEDAPNLGCGYTGDFTVKCNQTDEQKSAGTCAWKVDISTCTPPTYQNVLDNCYEVPTTTTPPTNAPPPSFEDWLGVANLNLSIAELPWKHEIPTQAPLYPTCCEPFVGSVCRPTIDYSGNYETISKEADGTVMTAPSPVQTMNGKWQPHRATFPNYHIDHATTDASWDNGNNVAGSLAGNNWKKVMKGNQPIDEGFFPMVECRKQAKAQPRICPSVAAVKIQTTYDVEQQYPQCLAVCNQTKAQNQIIEYCNRSINTPYPERNLEALENATHQKKIDSMKAKRDELYTWTSSHSRLTIPTLKIVIDCIDAGRLGDTTPGELPTRYNSLALPKMRSGFVKMPKHKQCRLHNCEINQCLVVKKVCALPFISQGKETEHCSLRVHDTTFECVDKESISSSNPMSLGFGLAWVIIGMILGIVAIYMLVSGGAAKVQPYAPSD